MQALIAYAAARPRRSAVLAGLATATGQAPLGLWPLALAGFAALFGLFAVSGRAREALWIGWFGGTASYALSLSWIVEPFLVDIATHGFMAPFALFFMAGGLALFWAAAFWLARAWGRPFWAGIPALWAAWSLAEMLRGHAFTGFPWNLPGYLWLDTSGAQVAAWLGPYGLTAATLLVGAGAALAWRRSAIAGVTAGLVLACLVLGAGGLRVPGTIEAGLSPFTVRLVQPNAAQHLKWHPDHAPVFYARAVAATAAQPRPDLIVWPETSIPALLNHAGPPLAHIAEQAAGVPVIAGIQRREGADNYYNALIRIDPGGRVGEIYDKHHLVPFGEYLPFGAAMSRLGLSALADLYGGGYTPGPGPRIIDTAGRRALPLICYEAVFARDTRLAGDRPDYLLQITNDAWFGQISGPHQHLAQARFRAIEQGLPLVRAANTGISAVIGPDGQVQAHLALGQAGHVDAVLPAPLAPTFYARIGDLPLVVTFLLLAAGLLAPRRADAD